MATRFFEKASAAVRRLAIAEGDVRERLKGAHFYLRQLREDEVPPRFRDEFFSIMSALTKHGPLRDPDGAVWRSAIENTMGTIRNSTGRKLAERIFHLIKVIEK